jgi:hypothetical protein
VSNSAFEAGVAVRDITPAPGLPLWGYARRVGHSTGTLDPLHAKALVLRAGADTVALVSLDLGRVPLRASRERIRQRAAAAGVTRVILTATHTHHAPTMELPDAAHTRLIEDRIGEVVEEAARSLRPAKIGVGRTQFDIAHNRRLIRDGRCLMLWRNEERMPTSPRDPEAGVVRIDATDGAPLAVLVNFACHPVVMGPNNLDYSADYPGELCRIVKEQTGAECLFLQGACGDVNPYLDKTPLEDGAVEAMRAVGRECAEAVLAVLSNIETTVPAQPSLKLSEKDIPVGMRWDLRDPEVQQFFRRQYGRMLDIYLEEMRGDLEVPLAVLLVNNTLALAFVPGEFFTRHQLALKENSPVPDTFLCGYANDFHLYFPPVRDAALGGYGGSVATYVGLGAAETLLTQACIEVGRLSGQLRPQPIPEDFQLVDYDPNEA